MGATYLRICCCCLSLGAIGYTVYERFLQSTGKTMLSTISQISGALVNIVLDAENIKILVPQITYPEIVELSNFFSFHNDVTKFEKIIYINNGQAICGTHEELLKEMFNFTSNKKQTIKIGIIMF